MNNSSQSNRPVSTLSRTDEYGLFHVGQEVLYSGETSYGRNAESERATVSVVGYCIILTINEPFKPKMLGSAESNPNMHFNPEKAVVNIGDYVSGNKRITPLN